MAILGDDGGGDVVVEFLSFVVEIGAFEQGEAAC
jgi:hypothetical protein